MKHAYPSELAAFVREHWDRLATLEAGSRRGRGGLSMCALPPEDALERLLSTIYQASLLREEERPVTFRVIVGPPTAFVENAGPPDGLHRLLFTKARPFTEHELRRLSPAAKYHRSLIGVENGPDLAIWGILQSGPRWLDVARGGRRSLSTLPENKLVVRVTGPGRVAVASGGTTLGEIRGGQITAPASDMFESTWLPAMFAAEREELWELHAADRDEAEARPGAEPWAPLDRDVTRILSQQMVKRIIATIRSAHHGGTVVILPPDRADDARRSVLRLKYDFEDAEPRRRFRTLIRGAMRALATSQGASATSGTVGWDEYRASHSPHLASLDEAVFEVSHLVAALADVDGAVVMTKRFEVLGFGAEIAGDFPDCRTVMRALDIEGSAREEEHVDGVGTRHRSAYRLASREREALVIVISQDGTVRFVRWLDGAVTYWDHVSSGATDG